MSAVLQLREQLAALLGQAPPGEVPLATGLAGLDALLHGGIPRGRVTELVGVPGSGSATLVRRLVETTAARDEGLWCAVVDATRTLAARDWTHLGGREGVWVIRPREAARAAWCADVLLRSGAFALVVLDGVPPLSRAVAVRLDRLAREHDAALLVVRDAGPATAGTLTRSQAMPSALRLRVSVPATPTGRAGWRVPGGMTVQVERGGMPRRVDLPRLVEPPRRLGRHPEPPDRRGAAARRRGRSA